MKEEILINGTIYVPKETIQLNDNNDLFIGKYVIVRCRDAGVHAGVLVSYKDRQCVLKDSRRLWFWKPADNKSFLSGAAHSGLDSHSKVGVSIQYLVLTENCEIILCTEKACKSISEYSDYVQD